MTDKKTEKPRVIDREMALYDLISAQAACDPVIKNAINPHFKNRYADLGACIDACKKALHNYHFAVLQTNGHDQFGQYVMTSLIHVSGEKFQSVVYLVLDRQNMQGLGSAITYARRYGLLGLVGLAPEDDDGNAASKAAPKLEAPKPISADQFQEINNLIFDTETDETKFCAYWKVEQLHDMKTTHATDAIAMLKKKKAQAPKEEDNGTAK